MTKSDRYFYSEQPKERGFLVGVDMRTHRFQQGILSIEDSLEELAAILAQAFGWSAEQTTAEVERTIPILNQRHGLNLSQ